jgi:hypothetical protein
LNARSVALAAVVTAAASSSNCGGPTTPDPGSPKSWPGSWSGSINSQAIGAGSARLVIRQQIGTVAAPLFNGSWSISFADAQFNAAGTLSGNLDASGSTLGIFFSRASVPCPGEPGNAAERAIAATFTMNDDRLRGNYIVGGCPGGTLDLTRQR